MFTFSRPKAAVNCDVERSIQSWGSLQLPGCWHGLQWGQVKICVKIHFFNNICYRFSSSDYWFNQMYYGTHGPFKRAEGGQAITFENEKVTKPICLYIICTLFIHL